MYQDLVAYCKIKPRKGHLQSHNFSRNKGKGFTSTTHTLHNHLDTIILRITGFCCGVMGI